MTAFDLPAKHISINGPLLEVAMAMSPLTTDHTLGLLPSQSTYKYKAFSGDYFRC